MSTVKCRYCGKEYDVDTNHHCAARQEAIFGAKTKAKGKKQSPANKLTAQVIDYINNNGGTARRVNVQGRFMEGKKFKDVTGANRQLPGKWIPSGMKKGFEDVSAVKLKEVYAMTHHGGPLGSDGDVYEDVVFGQYIAIEVKIGKDKQSPEQVQRQKELEAVGGIYYIARDIESFKEFWGEV